MIPYFFPPEGNAGVYRPLRFVRQLSKMGWGTTVVCADPYRYERYDPELLTLVPTETEVIRVRGGDPWQAIQAWRGQRMVARLTGESFKMVEQICAGHHTSLRSLARETVRIAEAWYYLPDMAMPWIRPTVEAIVHECARKPSNVIWATVGPVSSGVVAQQASERTGIPYVLDFRDPWGLDYYEEENKRPGWTACAARRVMYRILEQAQAVVFLFDKVAECYWHAYRGALDSAKIHIIPNGYEGSPEEFNVPPGEKCTILYAGNLSTYRYDTLLQGLHSFKQANPILARRLHLLFVGDGMNPIAREASTLGLSEIVETMAPTSYAEILRIQREAHAFLILGRNSDRKGHELVAGAKLFGYLKARRPIIGVLPDDETKNILLRAGVSTIANVESSVEVSKVFQRVINAWLGGTLLSLLPDHEACEAFSAERQTVALTHALEGKMATDPFIPGTVSVPASFQGEIVI